MLKTLFKGWDLNKFTMIKNIIVKKASYINIKPYLSKHKRFNSILIGVDPKSKEISSFIIGENPKYYIFGNESNTTCFDIEQDDVLDKKECNFLEYLDYFYTNYLSDGQNSWADDSLKRKYFGLIISLNYECYKFLDDFKTTHFTGSRLGQKNKPKSNQSIAQGFFYRNLLVKEKDDYYRIEIVLHEEEITKNSIEYKINSKGFKLANKLRNNILKEDYLAKILKIKDHVRQGDVYQINFTSEYSANYKGHPLTLFNSLIKSAPADYFAYLEYPNKWILSTSMESFICREDNKIQTKPIKGTAAKTNDQNLNNINCQNLLDSSKEKAELSMIVDLLRNDISKVCQYNNVKVKDHRTVNEYATLYHTESTVFGTLKEETSNIDILKAMFPGGSVTGCPKIKAMQLIRDLELRERGIYTGSIGFYSFFDYLNLNIAIRTVWGSFDRDIESGKLNTAAGGGIVYDSNPEEEYKENLQKTKWLTGLIDS